MAASEIRRAIIGNIPDCLRNCVNKEYFQRSASGGTGGYSEAGKFVFKFIDQKYMGIWNLDELTDKVFVPFIFILNYYLT